MDSSTKRRLAIGFLSSWVGRLASTIVQLVQVPVFLHFWSLPLYGDWMIVNSVPAYLSFSNIGFGSVAGNEMSILVAAGDREKAIRVFQSCWWLISGLCAGMIVLLGAALLVVPPARLLHLTAISETDTRWIIFYLGVSVLLGQLEQLLQAAYRCIGRYSYGSFVKSTLSLVAFTCLIVPVMMGSSARVVALTFAGANVAGTALLVWMVRRDVSWLPFGWSHASFSEIRRLAPPALAFMGFPVGQAMNLQGTLMAVGYALGPTAVVVFGTARTVSRVALQMVQMVNATVWPEMSVAFGQKDVALLRTLHRRACQIALLIAMVVVLVTMTLGPWFLRHWTGGHVPPSGSLLSILLFVVVLYALWSTSSTLVAAINLHQSLATYYIVATTVACGLTYLLALRYGLYGAAWSLVFAEAVMNVHVLPNSLRISEDTLGGFMGSMMHYPEMLRPGWMMARLRRGRAG